MDYLVKFQLNIVTVFVLLILFGIIKVKTQLDSFGKRTIEAVIIATVIGVVMEPLTWFFDGKVFFGAFFLEYFTNFVLIFIAPVIGALMLSYVDYFIFKDLNRIKKRWYYFQFAIFTFLMLVINFFNPVYFKVIKGTNIYEQGDLFWIHYVLIGLMYLYMVIFVLKNRGKTYKHVVNIFLIFFMLPILGMVIQLYNSDLFFAWNSIALAILVTYVFLESNSTEKDYLTKLFNRQSYEKYVLQMIETKKDFGIMLIDLDKFKDINDDYGHQKGDFVLVEFSYIIQKEITSCQFASRLAGDEFIIVIDKDTDINFLVDEIYRLLQSNPDKVVKNLKFSYGYSEYKKGYTLDQLYAKVDKEMYENKSKLKSENN